MNFNQLFGKKGGSKKAPQTNNVEQTSFDVGSKNKRARIKIK